MTTVAIVNQKGGTGKTTTTINLGSALAQAGKQVLVLDLDPQGNLSYSLGIMEFEMGLANAMLGEIALQEVLVRREKMDVAPSDVSLADAELSLVSVDGRERILSRLLNGIKGYDYILIDCPPSLSILTINALCASDKVIIPMQMEVLSLQGLDMIIKTINKVKKAFAVKPEILGLLPVMVDARRKLSGEVRSHIADNYDIRMFNTSIRTSVKASESPSFGKSVVKYQPSSSSAKDYQAFAAEFLNLTGN
jgi:chromosome partitioning protein